MHTPQSEPEFFPHDADTALLDRILAGSATSDDQARLDTWLAADRRHAALLKALREAHATAGTTTAFATTASATDAAWQALQERMGHAADRDATVRPIHTAPGVRRAAQTRGLPTWLRVAAVLVVGVIGGVLWRNATASQEYTAPLGQRISMTLPDGSRMTLAGGSSARVPRSFGAGSREITLQGEGHFDVVHDTTQPFRVRAGNVLAEDVGTRFVVRAWPEVGGVEVAVEEGIVALAQGHAAPTLLHAGDRGRVTSAGRVEVRQDGAERAAWIRGEFVFDGTALSEALPALARWYGVTLTATPDMLERRVTGQFAALPLDPMLESLALALNAQLVRNGSTITFSSR
ncbi:MAG: FecR domain-containing protein [Gemmatimonadaceae bacterium]|nr:FecR domain-containing protein [Gemmatimonadaceae bacterium]